MRTSRRLLSAFVLHASSLLITGCVAYTRTEIALADQARKGLTLLRAVHADHAALAGRLTELQRKQLDAAFDTDVREAAELSPDWIVEHRKAYSAGLDALAQQRAASTSAASAAARNVEAAEAALLELQRLQNARLRLEKHLSPEQSK
jgi:hypothetical protein